MSKPWIMFVALIGIMISACSGPSDRDEISHVEDPTAVTVAKETLTPTNITLIDVDPDVSPASTASEVPTSGMPTASTSTPTEMTSLATPPELPMSTPTTGYVHNPDASDPAYCALANRPPLEDEKLAEKWSEVCFPTSTVVPVPPLSRAYLDPAAAVRVAMQELGINPRVANPLVQRLFNSTLAMTKAYHLVTVDLGYFNQDTTEFLDWIMEVVELQNKAGLNPERDAIAKLAGEQAYSAIYEPNTDIGIQIRLLELGVHPLLPGSGPEVYWEYLIEPLAALRGRNLDWERSAFSWTVIAYRDALLSSPLPPADFGAYLVSVEYLPPGIE